MGCVLLLSCIALQFMPAVAASAALARPFAQLSAAPQQTDPPPEQAAQSQQASPQTAPPQQQQPLSSDAKRVDLGKFVSTATTPVGLIIAGAITISFFEQKRMDTCGRVRALIMELRSPDLNDDRSRNLVDQINIYKSRLNYVHWGSTLVAITIIFFIATNLASSLGLIWPNFKFFQVVVVGGMLLGMATLGASFVMDLGDNMWKRKELKTELADFERVDRETSAMRRNQAAQARESKARNAA